MSGSVSILHAASQGERRKDGETDFPLAGERGQSALSPLNETRSIPGEGGAAAEASSRTAFCQTAWQQESQGGIGASARRCHAAHVGGWLWVSLDEGGYLSQP